MKSVKQVIQKLINASGYEFSRFPRQQIINKRDQHFISLLKKFQIDLLLDVGAAQGGYGEWVRNLGYQNKIISFEPLAGSFQALQLKTKIDPLWEVVNLAVGDKNENGIIHVAGNMDSSSLLPMLDTHEKAAPHTKVVREEAISKVTLDSFEHPWMNAAKSIFLKLDVQGYEKYVLMGASDLMKQITGLQLEMSLVPLYAGQILFEEQIKVCQGLGYQLYYIRPGFADPTGRLLQCDGIFFRE